MMNPEEIARLIEAQLPGSQVQVHSSDNVHYEAVVISATFDGQRKLQRHRQIYAALGERVGGDIHALSIQAWTPEEWVRQQG
ncbi:MAG: BolA/IbaG family iron-sulfur metabolism protein [Chromatiales bacterium]|nr:BolA/IbaG family iron-sulfur metabolism protein [Chromatiales bacterium]